MKSLLIKYVFKFEILNSNDCRISEKRLVQHKLSTTTKQNLLVTFLVKTLLMTNKWQVQI